MPIYEYECESCHQTFEQLVINNRDAKTPCPCCGSEQTRKLISCASFLGGSGDRNMRSFRAQQRIFLSQIACGGRRSHRQRAMDVLALPIVFFSALKGVHTNNGSS